MGLTGVPHQDGHGADAADLLGLHGLALLVVGKGDLAHPLLAVHQVAAYGVDGRDLAGRGDLEASLVGDSSVLVSEAYDDAPQAPALDVQHTLPHDLLQVYVQLVAAEDVVLHEAREEVVGAGDRVEVPREVDVDVLHGQHLGVAAPRRPALDAEHWAEAWLPEDHYVLLPELAHRLSQPYGHRGLALTGLRRRHGGHYDELPVRPVLPLLQDMRLDLGLVFSIKLDIVIREPEA